MNPGKLADTRILDRVFTPSFNLLELEARILKHGSLKELADRIAKCVRCGKCKPVCCVWRNRRSTPVTNNGIAFTPPFGA